MAIVNRTFTCTKDVQLVHSGSTDGGIGKGNVVSVGQTPGGAKTRTEFEFQADWTDAVTVLQALLQLKVTNTCVGSGNIGNAVKFYVERVTTTFKEGNENNTCGVGSTNAEKWPGASDPVTSGHVTANRVEYVGAPSDGDYLHLDLTAMCETLRAAGDSHPRFRLIASDGAGGYDEANANRYVGFWSRERGNDGAGFKPRLELKIDTTHAPNVPADVSPATTDYQGPDEAATRVNTTFTVKARFTDDDQFDYLVASQVQFYTKQVTDDSDGTIHLNGGALIQTLTGDGVKADYPKGTLAIAQTIAAPDSYVGSEIRGRLRARDSQGHWSDWTRVAAMRVIPNTPPSAPTNLSVDTSSTTPDFRGRHNDADQGSTVSAVETQVARETAAGVQMLMNHTSAQPGDPTSGSYVTGGDQGADTVPGGGVVWTVTFQNDASSGTPLSPGWRVKRRHRTVDQFGAVGDWCSWQTWVVGQKAVPTVLPDAQTVQNTLTPLVGGSYPSSISAIYIEAYADNDLHSLSLWKSGKVAASGTSKKIAYGSVALAKALTWGQGIWIRVMVTPTGSTTNSPWSELSPVVINSLPLAPRIRVSGALQDANGIWQVPSLTPRLLARFLDPDLPGDAPSKQIAQVFSVPAGNAPKWRQVLTSGIEQFVDIPTAAGLAWETVYLAQVQYADGSRQLGPAGSFKLRTHRPSSLATGTAPSVHDPTPTIRWTATFYGGVSQLGYQVTIDDVTGGIADHIHDSGFVENASATSYVVPAYVLEDGHDYQVFVYITDTDGIVSLLRGAAPTSSMAALGATSATLAAVVSVAPSGNLPADTFSGTLSDTWGTSSSGHTYDYQGDQTRFDEAAGVGTIAVYSATEMKAQAHGAAILSPTVAVKAETDKLAVGGTLYVAVSLRCRDLSNHYRASLQFNTNHTVDLLIERVVSGVAQTIGSYRTAITHAINTFYWVKATISGTTLQAKAWADGGSEPAYQLSVTDSTALLQTAGSTGMGAGASSAITNEPVTVSLDGFATT